ncbi:MAG: hypothetical protein ACYDB9_02010 [Gammaproteobacteria bacterium]
MFRLQNTQSERPPGLVARVLVLLLVAVSVVVALFFGVIIIAIVIGIGLILFVFLYARTWWLRRKLGLNVRPRHQRRANDNGITIEGEYTVEHPDEDNRDEHP